MRVRMCFDGTSRRWCHLKKTVNQSFTLISNIFLDNNVDIQIEKFMIVKVF